MRVLERLPRESGGEYALRTIRENITHLDLKPGSPISENDLAQSLGLSRTPVRQALHELARVRAVEIIPQKTSIVTPIDVEIVEEYTFMRNHLECAVVELCCEMAAEQDLNRLRENVHLQQFYLESYYSETLMELDTQFHRILFEIARKSDVYTMMQNWAVHFDRVRSLALTSVKNTRIVQDHEDIIEGIAAKKAKEMKRLMAVHLGRYEFDIMAIREKYPQYFKA